MSKPRDRCCGVGEGVEEGMGESGCCVVAAGLGGSVGTTAGFSSAVGVGV